MHDPNLELAASLHSRLLRDGMTQRQAAGHIGASQTTIQRMLAGQPVRQKTRQAVLDWLAKDAGGAQPPILRDPVALEIHRAGPLAREVASLVARIEHKHRKDSKT